MTAVLPVGDNGKRVLIGIKPENQSELEFAAEGRCFSAALAVRFMSTTKNLRSRKHENDS